MKKIIIVQILILSILVFNLIQDNIVTAFNKQAENQNEELVFKVIASIPEENIYLYALPEVDGWHQGMILSINEMKKYFDWKSTQFLSFLPELYYLDLNNDGKKELAVLIVENHGTGMYENKVHIINTEDLSEYPVENALDVIKENVETTIISDKEVDIKIDHTIHNVKIGENTEGYTGVVPTKIPKVYYEDYTKYYIIDSDTLTMDNALRVKVGVETQPLRYLGWIIIEYSFETEEFKAKEIVFEGKPTIIVTVK